MLDQLKSALQQSLGNLGSAFTRQQVVDRLHQAFGRDKLYKFHGGRHIGLGKHLTNASHLYRITGSSYYLLSMQQHKGPKPIAVVKEGDQVTAGQNLTSYLIQGELPIHAPVAGKIVAIMDYLYANVLTKTANTIVLQADQGQATLDVAEIPSLNLAYEQLQAQQADNTTSLASTGILSVAAETKQHVPLIKSLLSLKHSAHPERITGKVTLAELQALVANYSVANLASQAQQQQLASLTKMVNAPTAQDTASTVSYDTIPNNYHDTLHELLGGYPIGPQVFDALDIYNTPIIEHLGRIKQAGIAGLGGAVFPSARKINNREFKTLLVNAAECEPYITCDDQLMQNYSTQLIKAFSFMQHLIKCQQIIVAIEDDKPHAVTALQQSLDARITALKDIIVKKSNFKLATFIELVQVELFQLQNRKIPKALRISQQPVKKLTRKQARLAKSQAQAEKKANFDPTQVTTLDLISQEGIGQHLATGGSTSLTSASDPTHAQVLLNPQLEALCKCLDNDSYLLAVELQALLRIKIRVLPTRYPSGNQRTTIEVLTGVKLTKKQNLTSMGAICFNVATIYSIYRAVTYGEVLTQRLVTLTGLGIAKPGNYWLPFGITPSMLIETIGVTEQFTGKVIMGGPMMGFELDNLHTPINKACNCLIFVGESEAAAEPKLFGETTELSCIRCTSCQQVCPMELQPQQLYWYERDKNDQKLLKANLTSCVECGLCDYVCPSSIPLVSYFQTAKYRIFNKRQKDRIAEESKVRFEIKAERDAQARAAAQAKREEARRLNEQRQQAQRAKILAETGVDPIEEAKKRLASKGVAVGHTTAVANPNAAPDNSDIMEQRRKRREARAKAAATKVATATVAPNVAMQDSAAIHKAEQLVHQAQVARTALTTATADALATHDPSFSSYQALGASMETGLEPNNATQQAIAQARIRAANNPNPELSNCEGIKVSPAEQEAIAAAVARAKAKVASAKDSTAKAAKIQAALAQAKRQAQQTGAAKPHKAFMHDLSGSAITYSAVPDEVTIIQQENEDHTATPVVDPNLQVLAVDPKLAAEVVSQPTPVAYQVPDKAAILAAVAAAKAKKAARVAHGTSDKVAKKTPTIAADGINHGSAVAAKIAAAKAAQAKAIAAQQATSTATTTSTSGNTPKFKQNDPEAIKAAVAAAKAKREAKLATTNATTPLAPTTADSKVTTITSDVKGESKAAMVANAVARAKAAALARQHGTTATTVVTANSLVTEDTSSVTSAAKVDTKATTIANAVARAKSNTLVRQQAQTALSASDTTVTTTPVTTTFKQHDPVAIKAAVAAAKAKREVKLASTKSTSTTATALAPTPTPTDNKATIVANAVARAKVAALARQQAQQGSSATTPVTHTHATSAAISGISPATPADGSNTVDAKKVAVANAVARAKAAALARQQGSPQPPTEH